MFAEIESILKSALEAPQIDEVAAVAYISWDESVIFFLPCLIL